MRRQGYKARSAGMRGDEGNYHLYREEKDMGKGKQFMVN